jgi:hypothetical protein
MKALNRVKAGGNVHALLAALTLLLSSSALPPPARGDHTNLPAPEAFCGFKGVRDLILRHGDKLPLPIHYENATDLTYTFAIEDFYTNIFHFPELLGPALTEFAQSHPDRDRKINVPLVLGPHSLDTFDELGYTIPDSFPVGTDFVRLVVIAARDHGPLNGGQYVATCEYNLTVIPRIPNGQDLITVPVRWCATEGSPKAKDEGKLGPTSNGGKIQTLVGKPLRALLGLLQQVNDQMFVPQSDTHILFRHANASLGIPVIDDPDGTAEGGALGDLGSDNAAFDKAIEKCKQAWYMLDPAQRGTPLVNIGQFLNTNPPKPEGAAGRFGVDLAVVRPQLCKSPAELEPAWLDSRQGVVVYDPYWPHPQDTTALITLGHELGHSLGLGHGDGLDNDLDGDPIGAPGRRLYDEICDGVLEDAGTTAHSLMDAIPRLKTITPLQRETLRSIAKLVPGATFTNVNDPGGSLIALPRACEPACGLPPDLFLTEAAMAEPPSLGVTSFWHSVRGPLPANATSDYLAFVDLDNDSTTGCDPSALFSSHTGFAGAELALRVRVTTVGGGEQAVPAVWRCQGGSLQQLVDPAIHAQVVKPGAVDLPENPSQAPTPVSIALTLPNALRGPAADRIRLQAIAQRVGGAVDRLPATGDGGIISLIPPPLPECRLANPILAPGGRTTVKASQLTANRPADVLVGDQIVATGATDATGNLAIDLVLPASSRQGLRPVAVILHGGAESATCSVLVYGNPKTPATVAEITPSHDGTDWSNTAVHVELAAMDIPGGPGIRAITYSAEGAQFIPVTEATSNPVSVLLSSEGRTVLSFFATNQAGLTEAPQSLTVQIDETAPVVTYSGNAGSYGITATVDIACTASDSLSGIAATTCEDIEAPAYTFAAGANSRTAEAFDFARNRGEATTSFRVDATYDDLCLLSGQFRSGQALGESLCAILNQAQRDQAAGRQDRKRERIDTYIDMVRKNVPRVFTQPQADVLIKFATACVNAPC